MSSRTSPLRDLLAGSVWLQILVVAAAYSVVGRLSLQITVPREIFGTIWPASGVALAALLLGGRRLWPGVWLGSATTVLLTSLEEGSVRSLLPALIISLILGAGAAFQALLGVSLVRRFSHGHNLLDRQHDVLVLLFWGGIVSCSVGASLGMLTQVLVAHPTWGLALFAWGTWWAGDSIGTLIAAPLVLLWADRRPAWARRRWSVTIPLAATLAVVILLFLFASRREEELIRGAFDEQAQELTGAIRASCEDHLEALHSITLVAANLPTLDAKVFHTVVSGELDRRPGIQALSWNPVVRDAERKAFERAAGFRISERDGQGRLRPAAVRESYVPVLFVEPLATDARALGFDVGSEASRRAALEKARDEGDVAATRRIRLVVQASGQRAVLLFSPVYATRSVPDSLAERRSRLRGFATAALRLDQLVAEVTSRVPLKGMTFLLLDTQAEGANRILLADASWNDRLDDPGEPDRRESIVLGGRTWEVRVARLPAALSGARSWRSSAVLLVGLLFTGLLGAFLLVLTSRATQVEELVVHRTAELERELQEHRRTEDILRASEARAGAILNHMIGGMITFDPQSRIESVNPAAERIFGYREEELAGLRLDLLMAEVSAPDAEVFLQRSHRLAIGRVTEWLGRRKSGEVFPFEVALFEFEAPAGRRFAANVQDISERREVDRLKAEFVATVSHELRTPLTSIRGSLGLLIAGVGGELPAQGRELVRLAERNAVRLSALINDILDFERLDSGKVSMHFAAVPLDELVEQSFESVRAFADEHGITLTSLPMARLHVWVDADRIIQVLVNLLSNAIKFSGTQREVAVWAEQMGGRVRVYVKDHGRGISGLHRQRIFERFFQVEVADQRAQGGTGLGLAICKAIIEHHGGRMGVESEEGVGSTFWFEVSTSSDSYVADNA